MDGIKPYLNFNGNCEEVFNFYGSIFGSGSLSISRFKEVPSEHKFPEHEGDKILHVSLQLSGGSFLMGSDIPEAFPKAIIGTNFYISLDVDSEKEAARIFNGLAADGQVTMPLAKTFWGAFFGMLIDKFSVQWMISYDYSKN